MKLTRKDVIQILITIGLAVVLALILLKRPPVKTRRQAASPVPAAVPSYRTLSDQLTLSRQEGYLYEHLQGEVQNMEFGRDPFQRVEAPPPPEPETLHLLGIIWDEDNVAAMIDGEIVQVGDTVKGHKILEIHRDRVVVSDGEGNLELKLEE